MKTNENENKRKTEKEKRKPTIVGSPLKSNSP